MKIKPRIREINKYQYWGYLFITPWIIGFIVLQLYPLLASLNYSFTDFNMLNDPRYIGFQNYIRMFTKDVNFSQSVKVTLIRVLFAVPMKIIFALMVAMLLNIRLKGMNFYRTIFYLPSIFGGSVAISVLWKFLFMREGLINRLLSVFSIKPVDWLGNPDIALFTVSLVTIWEFGSSMVLFLAGLKQIPRELYEAAKIDGASLLKQFYYVTLPLLTPIVFFNLVMQTINAFQEFTTPFVITSGGPAKSTYLYAMLIYENGFKFLKMGYASALSWLMFIAIIIITALVFKSSPYWVYYGDGGST
ncbi:MAG TPA: sugar ABC transporter permease [Clostridiaceae bacterium]|nr:sugar ABC transporter permease [Clostridiaceae bacterium]